MLTFARHARSYLLLYSQSSSVRWLTASRTIIFHHCLSSTVLNSSSIVNSIQSLILLNQFVFGLPLAWAPSVVPWIIFFPPLSAHLSSSLCVQSMSFSFSLLL